MRDVREYQRLYQQRRYAARIARMHTFLGGICAVCGTSEGLEIHHVDPTEKVFVLTTIYGHTWKKIETELLKCELRCELHHKERHAAPHGASRCYKNGCRCDLCVDKFRADGRKYTAAYKARERAKRLEQRA